VGFMKQHLSTIQLKTAEKNQTQCCKTLDHYLTVPENPAEKYEDDSPYTNICANLP